MPQLTAVQPVGQYGPPLSLPGMTTKENFIRAGSNREAPEPQMMAQRRNGTGNRIAQHEKQLHLRQQFANTSGGWQAAAIGFLSQQVVRCFLTAQLLIGSRGETLPVPLLTVGKVIVAVKECSSRGGTNSCG